MNLLVPQGMGNHMGLPRAQLSPRVQNCNAYGCTRGLFPARGLVKGTEFRKDFLHAVNKFRELQSQGKVAAIAHTIQGTTDDCTTSGAPRFVRLTQGISTLTEDIWEEVGKEAPLGVAHTGNIGDHAAGCCRTDGSNNRIHLDRREVGSVGFHTDPVIAEEHHGLATLLVDLANQFSRLLGNSLGGEIDPVSENRSGSTEGTVVPAAIDKVLGSQRIAVFLFKLFHRRDRHRGRVSKPVNVAFAASGIKGQGEVVEEGRKTNHVHLRVGLKPDRQGVLDVLPGPRKCHIEGALLHAAFFKRPVVRQIVVHLSGIPHLHGKEVHGVHVEGNRLVNCHHRARRGGR